MATQLSVAQLLRGNRKLWLADSLASELEEINILCFIHLGVAIGSCNQKFL